MNKYRVLFCGLCVASAMTICPAQADEGARLAAISEKYFQDMLALNPLEGTQITGEAKYEDKLEDRKSTRLNSSHG